MINRKICARDLFLDITYQLSDNSQKFFADKDNYCSVCPQMTDSTIPGFPIFTQTFLFAEADTWPTACYFLFLIHHFGFACIQMFYN